MTDFFTMLYPDAVSNKNAVLERLKIYSLIRFIIRNLANAILPLYYRLTRKRFALDRIPCSEVNDELIISLTSFPARIRKVHLVIETLLRQTELPDRIILWLSKEQFPTIDHLPKELLRLQSRGLEIYIREGDLRSYKKIYYTLIAYPKSDIIIIDDDTFYPSDTIEKLVKCHRKHPNTVCFNRGYQLKFDNGNISKYKDWILLTGESGPRYDIMATGVGGVYYPANILHDDVLDKSAFMEVCSKADDIWLYFMTIINKKKLVKTDNVKLFLPIFNIGDVTLTSENVNEGLNDKQINQLRFFLREKGLEDPIQRLLSCHND